MSDPSKLVLAAGAAVFLSSCGSGGPAAPPRIPTHTVSVFAFYDQNGNTLLDGNELVKFPNATVTIGGVSGRTDSTGRAVVAGVPEGAQTAVITAESLPPYFTAAPVPVTVPATAEIRLPVVLPLGNRIVPNKYMAFGDSLSFGTYESALEAQLRGYFGAAQVVDEANSGTRSQFGAQRISDGLDYARPAHTLILYGTNDWNDLACKDDRFPCFTIDSLRAMVREARFYGSHPYLATLPPVNVGFSFQSPPEREEWTKRMNDLIRKLARDENVVLVDLHKGLTSVPDQRSIFTDYVHLNSQGYTLIANEFFKALTQRQTTTTAWR